VFRLLAEAPALPLDEALRVARAVLSALEAAHALGVERRHERAGVREDVVPRA